jgi:diguanylate cyclase (GGDEF)-like protein
LHVLSTPQPAAFLAFDIDRFKPVNDRYGHEIGDRVLQILCGRARNCLREDDVLARFGGEEFVIFLPQIEDNAARSIAERIRDCVGQEPFSTTSGNLTITVSIGVALHTGALETQPELEKVLNCADKAMYAAKQRGRNCVEFYS